MSRQGQRLDTSRYAIIPRTLSFLLRREAVLLMRVATGRGAWSGRLNGVGGHIERGEDPLSSARRELREETGLEPEDLRLCGVIMIDLGGSPGIGLYIFAGQAPEAPLRPSPEGELIWTPLDALAGQPLVEDLPIVLPRALACYAERSVFSGLYAYRDSGELEIRFAT